MYDIVNSHEGLGACYDICKDSVVGKRLTMSKESFIERLSDCDVLTVKKGDDVAGCFFYQNGPYLHGAMKPSERGIGGFRVWPAVVNYGKEKYGQVILMIHKDNAYTHNLVKRMAFSYKGLANDHHWWVL